MHVVFVEIAHSFDTSARHMSTISFLASQFWLRAWQIRALHIMIRFFFVNQVFLFFFDMFSFSILSCFAQRCWKSWLVLWTELWVGIAFKFAILFSDVWADFSVWWKFTSPIQLCECPFYRFVFFFLWLFALFSCSLLKVCSFGSFVHSFCPVTSG